MNNHQEKEVVNEEQTDQQGTDHQASQSYFVPNRHDRRKAKAIKRKAEKLEKKKNNKG